MTSPAVDTFTPTQLAFIDMMVESGNTRDSVENSIRNGLLYAEAIDTLCGGFSTGSMGTGDTDVPALYLSKQEAEDEVKDGQKQYADDIAAGERDEDDEYEGEVYRVLWDSADNLWFFPPESTGTSIAKSFASQSISRAMGH